MCGWGDLSQAAIQRHHIRLWPQLDSFSRELSPITVELRAAKIFSRCRWCTGGYVWMLGGVWASRCCCRKDQVVICFISLETIPNFLDFMFHLPGKLSLTKLPFKPVSRNPHTAEPITEESHSSRCVSVLWLVVSLPLFPAHETLIKL